jgi:spore germination protein GerM
MKARRTLLAIAVVAPLVAGCAIQPDTAPRDIPESERGLLEAVPPEGGETGGSTRVFLVAEGDDGQPRLRPVVRSVDAAAGPALQELFKGPNDVDFENGLGTALPAGLQLVDVGTVAGTLQVEVTPEILDVPAPSLVLAVAQIVFTASELDGVSRVRLRVDQRNRAWPDSRGELQEGPLSVYDYPGVAESTQPPYPPIPSGQPAD